GSVTGGVGRDILDYSQYKSPHDVLVNLQTGVATGVSGGISGMENVTGGEGNDILVGDAEDNILKGGKGRDLIIGGQGDDLLDGGADDDLLIAAWTAFDTDKDALLALQDAWSNPSWDYGTRIAALRYGVGPNLDYKLIGPNSPSETVWY